MTRRDWLLFGGLMLVITVIALPTLTYPLGRDQGEFATIGRGLLHGKIPYIDLWNPKPPAVFYLYALAMQLLGSSTAALRALDLLAVPVISAALFWLGSRIAHWRVGLFAAVIFPAFYFTESFWTLTQNDGLVLLPMALAVVFAVKAADESESWRGMLWALGAGVGCGLAVWFKYPFALFAVVPVVAYVAAQPHPCAASLSLIPQGGFARGRDFRNKQTSIWDTAHRAILALLAFLAGGLLIVGGGIAVLAGLGALDELILSAQVTAQYTALTFNPQDFGALMQMALGFRWRQWGLLWILAAVWFLLGRSGERRGRLWGMIVLWALIGLAMMLVQAKGYDYHWLPMLPPLALMGADTLDRLINLAAQNGLARRSQIPATFLTVLLLLVIEGQGIWPRAWHYLTGREDQIAYYGRFQAGEFVADESLAVATYLRERVAPGDSLYIWGFRPEVYYLSGLNPATRFIFQFPLVAPWYPTEWRQENVEVLWAALPPYVLVLQVDYMPWVTGRNEDSHTLLQEYNELNDWLIFNYEREAQIGNFFVWKRKTS
ncbi:MAG: glycosyltransferase family 39 protein [Anaerolineae bacterium]|nr:glycosyltransferase family 39 protein [Anaerolineae bacterium]